MSKLKHLSLFLTILLTLQLLLSPSIILAETYSDEYQDESTAVDSSQDVESIEEVEEENENENENDSTDGADDSTKVDNEENKNSSESVVEEHEEQDQQEGKEEEKQGVKEGTLNDSEETNSDVTEVDVIGEQHPPFSLTTKPNALMGIRSGDNWPAPGSLKLNKQAEETSKYDEWEVTLSIEGKNLKTSSDIVIVFDKSGSMTSGSRLAKAKAAANQFVDNLLIEGSATRIALVEFSSTATKTHDFTDFTNKQGLKNRINRITATGGTHIQAGLHQAKLLLQGSTADQKTIVLLSDGEPTYSFKAGSALAHSWPSNKYNYILSNFNYSTTIGSGSSYDLSRSYTVNTYRVSTNGIATISEAKHIMDTGIGIYSVGLEVGNNAKAKYVLENSQNKGYYLGGSDAMTPIFEEIAASLVYPASNAIVTDPLGDMFNLVKDGSYNGQNFVASHGAVTWNENTETFSWNIGNVKEGEMYTLKYKVKMDCTKNPNGKVKYPTNKETPFNYKDSNGQQSTKQFPIPEVQIDKGKIDKKGYRVDINGDPVDSNGNVVSSPVEAEQFYAELFGDNLTLGNTYSVPANHVPHYTLHVGDDPTQLQLTAEKVCETVWFGYVDPAELIAGDVTAKYVDENGQEIADQEVFSGNIGDSYETMQKNIPGYEFKEVHPESDPTSGTFKKEKQTVIYVYTKKLGALTVNKKDDAGNGLAGAVFKLTGPDGFEETGTSGADGKIVFENLEWGKYTLTETKAPDGYRLLTEKIEIEITKENLYVIKEITNIPIGWEIPNTGGIGTLGFYGLGVILMGIALSFFTRRFA